MRFGISCSGSITSVGRILLLMAALSGCKIPIVGGHDDPPPFNGCSDPVACAAPATGPTGPTGPVTPWVGTWLRMSCEAWGTDHKKEDQVVIGPTGQMVNTISVYAPGDPGCAAAVVRTETWTYSYVVGPPGPAPGSHDLDLIFQSSVNAVSPPAGGTPSYTLIVLMNADSKLQFGLNDGPPHDESSPAKRPIIGDAFLEFLRQ